MDITKISRFCEPCEPLCEPFCPNGSHAKPMKYKVKSDLVNDVNHLHVRARGEKFSLLYFFSHKNPKKNLKSEFLSREAIYKNHSHHSHFLKCVSNIMILKTNSCEPFAPKWFTHGSHHSHF